MFNKTYPVIFDLDDTLVRYNHRKICVPKQTFHCLRDLKARDIPLYIVSYNPRCEMVAGMLGLHKYIIDIHFGSGDRFNLVAKVIQNKMDVFFYYDDRRDNIENVQKNFPNAICIHVSNPLHLYKLIKIFFSGDLEDMWTFLSTHEAKKTRACHCEKCAILCDSIPGNYYQKKKKVIMRIYLQTVYNIYYADEKKTTI